MGWRDLVGDAGRIVSLEHFGASADYQTLYREFGITAEAVGAAAKESIADGRRRLTRPRRIHAGRRTRTTRQHLGGDPA